MFIFGHNLHILQMKAGDNWQHETVQLRLLTNVIKFDLSERFYLFWKSERSNSQLYTEIKCNKIFVWNYSSEK